MDSEDPGQRVAVVTGGAKGIGRACAEALAEAGCRIVILSRDEAAGADAVAGFRAEGHAARHIAADVTSRASLKAAFADIERCDVLVNSAGGMSPRAFEEITERDFQALIDTNLIGLLATCQLGAARMGRGGRIVNIASRAALGGRGIAHYAATKAGVVALTRSIAIELLDRGITVNAVAPGFIDTPLSRSVLTPAQFEAFAARQPQGKPGTPEDVAWAVAFFASPRAGFVTGQCLFVDGGKSLPA